MTSATTTTATTTTTTAPRPSTWKRFVAGTASGAALVLVGHPLDLLMTRLQAGGAASMGEAVRATVGRHGVLGMWRGVALPLVTTGGVNTILWGVQFSIVDTIVRARGAAQTQPTTRDAMAAAVVSGALISFVVTPIEGVKSRMLAQPGTWDSKQGTLSVMKQIYDRAGITRGVYRGFTGVLICRCSNYAYFGGYAAAQRFLEEKWFGPDRKRLTALVAGGCAGITYWLSCYPAAVVKSVVMCAPDTDPPKYASVSYTHLRAHET